MRGNASEFQTSSAQFVARGNHGQLIEAKALGDGQVGRGLYVEQWRDFTWQFIARIVKEADGSVTIVCLVTQSCKENSADEPGVTREITISTVVELARTYGAEDQILLSNDSVARPKNRRYGKIITHVDEVMPD